VLTFRDRLRLEDGQGLLGPQTHVASPACRWWWPRRQAPPRALRLYTGRNAGGKLGPPRQRVKN
jgi:hypothetical protein